MKDPFELPLRIIRICLILLSVLIPASIWVQMKLKRINDGTYCYAMGNFDVARKDNLARKQYIEYRFMNKETRF